MVVKKKGVKNGTITPEGGGRKENDARVESTKVSDWIISEEVCPSSNNLECHAIHLLRVC